MPAKTQTSSDALQSRIGTAKTLVLAIAFAFMAVIIFGLQAYKHFTIEGERAVAKCYFQMYVMDKKEKQCKVKDETFTFTREILLENYGDKIDKVKTIIYVELGVGLIAFILFTIIFYKLLYIMDKG